MKRIGFKIHHFFFPPLEMITIQTKEHPHFPDLVSIEKIKSLSV